MTAFCAVRAGSTFPVRWQDCFADALNQRLLRGEGEWMSQSKAVNVTASVAGIDAQAALQMRATAKVGLPSRGSSEAVLQTAEHGCDLRTFYLLRAPRQQRRYCSAGMASIAINALTGSRTGMRAKDAPAIAGQDACNAQASLHLLQSR